MNQHFVSAATLRLVDDSEKYFWKKAQAFSENSVLYTCTFNPIMVGGPAPKVTVYGYSLTLKEAKAAAVKFLKKNKVPHGECFSTSNSAE